MVLLTHLTLQSRVITLKRGVTAWNLGAGEDSLGNLPKEFRGSKLRGQTLASLGPSVCLCKGDRSMVGYTG